MYTSCNMSQAAAEDRRQQFTPLLHRHRRDQLDDPHGVASYLPMS
jgi:hypothetical protein